MNVLLHGRRLAAALIAAAAIVPATAAAAPSRTATTTKYTRAVYLQQALGLPASNTAPAIESVTYDRFQHLLRQSGTFAILIGDPATDTTFGARAQEVETAASTAGVKKVYWFNPNLSGSATVGTVTVPALDIRNPASITSQLATTQARYGDAWLNLVAQSLGNGVTATRNSPNAQGQSVTIAPSTAVNDSANAPYDYTAGTPADATDSFFLVYNTENTSAGAPDKIVSSVNLTDDAAAATKVAAAITAVGGGGASFGRVDQFKWWQDEANARHTAAAGANENRGPRVPVVTEADNRAADGGWRVNQITYPELITLLNTSTDADAAILFGGTWCPNTRAVLPFVNQQAQDNNVQVYNFDTVLDGGIIAGNPTGGTNVFQSRNNHTATSQGTTWSFPSALYGELVTRYIGNFQTEYQTNNRITYYPGGDRAGTATDVRRLQVPYVIGYKGKGGTANQDGVTRSWIIKLTDTSWREFMSNWWLTNPQPYQIDLGALPGTAPAWTKINADLAKFDYRTDIATVRANTADFSDADQWLIPEDAATVTDAAGVSLNGDNPISISPASLATALAALTAQGKAPANYAAARADFLAAVAAGTDATLTANLRTVFGAWNIIQTRKSTLNTRWGSPNEMTSLAGGAHAKRALDVFFDGLPGGVVSTRTVTAPAVTAGTAPKIDLAIANEHGRKPAGTVTLTVKQGAATVDTQSKAVAADAVSFTLPALGAGTYSYALTYPGDDQITAFTENGNLTVNPVIVDPTPTATPVTPAATATPAPTVAATKVKATRLAGTVSKVTTSKKAGKYKVTITTPSGKAKASGKVTLKLKKGKTTKTITGTLKNGTVTVSVPKLAKGTWKVSLSWAGDANYQAASATGTSIKVKK